MKIITINVNKGGAGKTTFTHNFAEYLRQNSRVLLLDFDDSANLTNRYGYYDKQENTIIGLFKNNFVKSVTVADNLDLIAGHREVEILKEQVNQKRRREEIFGKWLGENEKDLAEKFDYIIIDTENDEGLLTLNAIIASDLVLGIAEPSKDSVIALSSLREFVSDLNHDFDGNVKLAFIANKINMAERASKDLLEDLGNLAEFVGYMPRRTVLAEDKSLFTIKLEPSQNTVKDHLVQLFDKVIEVVNQEENT